MTIYKALVADILNRAKASGTAVLEMLTGRETEADMKALEPGSPFISLVNNAHSGESFYKGGKQTGQAKHKKAQAEYREIRKEYAHVDAVMPRVTKKEKMRVTAKHKNISVSKVRDALREE